MIILFALLVKLVTLPLSMKSFKSMNAMKELQPKIEDKKNKHKKNPQAMTQDTKKLYKQNGDKTIKGFLPKLTQRRRKFYMLSV